MLIYINAIKTEIDQELTVATLLEQLDYTKDTFSVAINATFIARASYATTILQEQDNIDIVSAMQGG